MLELDLEQRYYKAIVRRPPFFWDKWSVFFKIEFNWDHFFCVSIFECIAGDP